MLPLLRRIISPAEPPLLVEALWIRLLGLVYLAAFGSMLPQLTALVGSHGIAPVSTWMQQLHNGAGNRAYLEVPSLFWLNGSDAAMSACCIAGCVFAVVLASGFLTRSAAALCFVLYLSIAVTGQPFTNFQWDALLLEAGFLAIFSGAPFLVWGYRFLLFRLMFESGIVKLTSHDPNWRNLHALSFHFFTQPLPNPPAYYAARLPAGILLACTALVFVIEVACPFFLFAPRRLRCLAVALLVLLQVSIAATGNYAFFNLLTIALCVWGLDDRVLAPVSRWLLPPRRVLRWQWALIVSTAAIAVLMVIGAAQLLSMLLPENPASALVFAIAPDLIQRAEIVNTYGLFAVMTTTRPELIVEGSNDSITWKQYTFRYKPGPLNRSLPVVAPYQPRLDWQMWFAALGTYQENSWMGGFLYRLLTGDRGVLGLLEPAPFSKPPRLIRVLIYDYRFTNSEEKARTGNIWERQLLGTWYGPVALRTSAP